MAHFFFDLSYDDEPWSEDPEGGDFASLDHARFEAIDIAAFVSKEQARLHRKLAIRIRERGQDASATLTLSFEPVT